MLHIPMRLCAPHGRRASAPFATGAGVAGWLPRSVLQPLDVRSRFGRAAKEAASKEVASVADPGVASKTPGAPLVPRRRQTPAWQPDLFVVPPAVPVPAHIERPSYADDPQGHPRPLREEEYGEVKSAASIARMRRACRLAAEALAVACQTAVEGVTTAEVDEAVCNFVIARGAYPVGINYYGFPRGLCASANEVVVHGIPNTRPLEPGDIVNFDVTVYLGGAFGDCSAMVSVGEVDRDAQLLVQTTEECLYRAIEQVGPGVLLNQIGDTCTEFANSRGFGVVAEFCGHFIGSELHMKPNVPHVPNGYELVLRPGMTFTIEPILVEGGPLAKIERCADGQTYVSRNGGWSAQWEHTVLVSEHGAEVLTVL